MVGGWFQWSVRVFSFQLPTDYCPTAHWFRQHRKRDVLQRAVGDDDQPLVAKLSGNGREEGLAQ